MNRTKSLTLAAYFSKGKDPRKLVPSSRRDCQILHQDGRVLFSMKDVLAPKSWSDLAVEIAASKYFYKGKKQREKSVYQMVERVVNSVVDAPHAGKYFRSKIDLQNFANELRLILLTQKAFFNSPVWFNCGIYQAYGARSRSENWAWSEGKPERQIKDSLKRPQVSACFIQSVDDSLEGIFELAKNEAKLFKFGSGSGTNFSSLRSQFESLDRGGRSSGLMAFLRVLDRSAGAIKSGGTTRRAAKMVCLDVDHPEIEEFIDWKWHEEKKAQALIAAGYSGEFEGEAYQTISGQNANNSVRLSKKFLEAVRKDSAWHLRAPTSGLILKTISAKKLWQQMAHAAWACADPGVQFTESIQKWHTCPESGLIRASNPCSEYMFLDDSACNLASLNLRQFLDEKNNFDIDGFLHVVKVIFIAQEILVDLAGYPTERICQNSHDFRPLGLGFAGLGSFLMAQGIPYDSKKGKAWAASLTALLTGTAYSVSAEMATVLGPFAGFKKNKKPMLTVLRKHQNGLKKIEWSFVPMELKALAYDSWKTALHLGQQSGFRNAQATVMAPTGTIGLVLDSDTTGIEPEFSLVKIKKMAGGGSRKLVSASLGKGLETLGYDKDQRDLVLNHVEVVGSLQGCTEIKPEHRSVFAGAMEISAEAHLLMMAAIQPFVSGAISKTINLPQSAKVEDVEEIYLRASKLDLKAVAIYRDGSKVAQPLKTLRVPVVEDVSKFPKCSQCGAPTELAGGCFRCVNCGSVIGCA